MITGDHPRMCGEHNALAARAIAGEGSSPHVRGTLGFPAACRAERGIIPACAGNTVAYCTAVASLRDHPHMCGEHQVPVWVRVGREGSSPHVRGTLDRIFGSECWNGIIPACAGNTMWGISRGCSPRDHPRMCGEHPNAYNGIPESTGSSPHVRGTHHACRRPDPGEGIIPACAGNTMPHIR